MLSPNPLVACLEVIFAFIFSLVLLAHAVGRLKDWQRHRLEALRGEQRRNELAALNAVVVSYMSVTGREDDGELAEHLRNAFGLVSVPSPKGFDPAALEQAARRTEQAVEHAARRMERAVERYAQTMPPEEEARQERTKQVIAMINKRQRDGKPFTAPEVAQMLEIAARPTVVYLPAAEAALRVRVEAEAVTSETEVPAASAPASRAGQAG